MVGVSTPAAGMPYEAPAEGALMSIHRRGGGFD